MFVGHQKKISKAISKWCNYYLLSSESAPISLNGFRWLEMSANDHSDLLMFNDY